MKSQLKKKENTKEERKREKEKDGDERTTESDLVLPASGRLKKPEPWVKSHIYSERTSFGIAFWVISELLHLFMELHVNIRKLIEKATCSIVTLGFFYLFCSFFWGCWFLSKYIIAQNISHCLWKNIWKHQSSLNTTDIHAY